MGIKRIFWWILLLLNIFIFGVLLWVFFRRCGNQLVGIGGIRVVLGIIIDLDFILVGEIFFVEVEVIEVNDLIEISLENGNEVVVVDFSISVVGVEGVGELLVIWVSFEKNS